MKYILLLFLFASIISCQNPVEDTRIVSNNHFHDSVLIEIENLQDRRETEQLLSYLSHENPDYRYAAAEAFASVQDSAAIEPLGRSLNDEKGRVRKVVAYALGQMYHESAQQLLINRLDIEDSVAIRKVLWEALGKCITKERLQYFANNANTQDSLELEGIAWGMYRAGVRGVYNDTLIINAVQFLHPDFSFETRFASAHFLGRTRDIDISQHADKLITSALYDKSDFVRMAAAAALRNTKGEKTEYALREKIIKDHDYRVRINALRAIGEVFTDKMPQVVQSALKDENINVAIAAANLLSGQTKNLKEVRLLLNDTTVNWRVNAILAGALIAENPSDEALLNIVQQQYIITTNPYEKASLLTALSRSFTAYEFVVTKTFAGREKVVGSAGIQGLASMRRMEDFPNDLKQPIAEIFKDAIATGDLAMIGTACYIISDPDLNFKNYYDTIAFLYEAKAKLSLPKDNEGLQMLEAAIDFFEGDSASTAVNNEYNHPIDWELVKSIAQSQKVKVSTEKGDIVLEMLVEQAPGSVVNFITLARKGYYNGKNFHRVVPNFVVQGGCNRGDGWGSEDYSIRSEFAPLKYSEGYVGMASAGKDTEGTQWFITHSPTPHLDGKYTIFARVYEGMEIVHQLEVGDRILTVTDM